MMRCSSSICRAIWLRVSAILRRRFSSAFYLATCSSNLILLLRSKFKRLIYSSCYCLRALSCWAFNLACRASSCLLIKMLCYILVFSMLRSLRSALIRYWVWVETILSYCIFSIFSATFSLFLYLSFMTSPARLRVSSIFLRVLSSSCLSRAIRLASS